MRALGILDTESEEHFDRLARLTSRLFSAPVVLIALVDEHRLWFKSVVGADVIELPRDVAFCSQTILQDAILEVPDTAAEADLAGFPTRLDEPLRYYAGCPIRSPDGYKVGVLCILDCKVRKLDDTEKAALRDIAAILEKELALLQFASQDALTGVPNRRGFLLLAQQSLAFCVRQNCAGTLVVIDVEGLHTINHTWGRAEGDLVLLVFADQLKKTFRGTDSFARISADQFCVFLANVTAVQASAVFARFNDTLQRYNTDAGRGYHLVFSLATVEFNPDQHGSLEHMLAEAEALIEQRKQQASDLLATQ